MKITTGPSSIHLSCDSFAHDTCREMAKLQHEAAALHNVREQCQAEVARMYSLLQSQQRKIQELEQSLSDTHQQLRVQEQQLESSQSKLRRMRAHLEMIAEGSEENSMSRRMILNLLAHSSP